MREEKLRAALLNREERVLERIIDKYSRLLWKVAAAVLENAGSEQDVEECVADAFIYLWEHPEKFRPERGSLKSLLCILVRSRAIDRYRLLVKRDVLPLEEAVLTETAGMQEVLLARETRKELVAAVNALGEPGREILIRRYYYGQKPREIALALGLTVKQVDNSLYRSKRALRQSLGEGKA